MSDFDHILWNLYHGLPDDFSEGFQEFCKVDNNNHLSVNSVDKSSCKPINNTILLSVVEVPGSNNHMDFAVQKKKRPEMVEVNYTEFAVQNNEMRDEMAEVNHTDFAVQNNEMREMHNEMREMPILDIHFSLPAIQSM